MKLRMTIECEISDLEGEELAEANDGGVCDDEDCLGATDYPEDEVAGFIAVAVEVSDEVFAGSGMFSVVDSVAVISSEWVPEPTSAD